MKLIIDIPDYDLNDIQNGSIACGQVLKAVKNGTPVSSEGDLISRSELKKTLQEYTQTQYNDDRPDLEYEYIDIDDLNYAIDNAPTVEPEEVYLNGKDYDLYLEGYKVGKKHFERPTGEWIITNETDEFYGRVYRCSRCSKETLACDCRNFCTWCGAEIRGVKE